MEAAPSATITQHGVGTPHYVKPLVADLGMSWVICQCRFYLSSPWWGPFQPGGGYKIELFLRFNLKFAQQERVDQDLKFNQGRWGGLELERVMRAGNEKQQ